MPVVVRPRPAQALPIQPALHQPATTHDLSPTQDLSSLTPVEGGETSDIHHPVVTGSHLAAETGDMSDALAARARREAEYKPFFTQIGPAVTNRQHNRVVMVVPLLLIVSLLLFLFAYIASK
jgi:hypothetical protein